jgi:serine/threonine protein kinase
MNPGLIFELDDEGHRSHLLTLSNNPASKEGGSGTVFPLPGTMGRRAAKLYHDEKRRSFEEKVRTMLRVKYKHSHADQFDFAWPERLIVDDSGVFLGFSMPYFGEKWVDLESLMQAAEAEQKYGFGDGDRIAVAANLAMAVTDLHNMGIYCVDLKPENVRVNLDNKSVGIIDCDGMSVIDLAQQESKRYPAPLVTPEFLAPENHGQRAADLKNEEAQDRFALAAIIFMLLNRGLHPFQGRLLVSLQDADTTAAKIRNNLFPYGEAKAKISPHPDSLYEFWPADLQSLFHRAFSGAGSRPSAEEWLYHLQVIAAEATPCADYPKYHLKYPLTGCPVCRRTASSPPAPPSTINSLPGGVGRTAIATAAPPPPLPPPPPQGANTLRGGGSIVITTPRQPGLGPVVKVVGGIVVCVVVLWLIVALFGSGGGGPGSSNSTKPSQTTISQPSSPLPTVTPTIAPPPSPPPSRSVPQYSPPTEEAANEEIRLANQALSRGDKAEALVHTQRLLAIRLALPNRDSSPLKRKIASTYLNIGLLTADRTQACNSINSARMLWIELGDDDGVVRTDEARRNLMCPGAPPAGAHFCPRPSAAFGNWCSARQRCNPGGGCINP